MTLDRSCSSNDATVSRPDASGLPVDGCDVLVVGTGYVGLTSAACLAHIGRSVVALDIDERKIARLSQGRIPILEDGLEDLVIEGLAAGRLRFVTDYEVARVAPVVMLCLPTPSAIDGSLDLRFVEKACRALSRLLPADAVVVTKSTVPVGTHERIAAWLGREDLHVVSNPEFLREGTAVSDFLRPDRIVIGSSDDAAGRRVASLYEGVEGPIQLTDTTSAELVKYAANTFLAAKLSFVNEMSRLCDALGADIEAVTEGIGSDHRIGRAFLAPGPGWGGSCFPKDTLGMAHLARAAGLRLPVTEGANHSNALHLDHIAGEIEAACPVPLASATVAVWGATFKAGTDDTRDSPAIEIIERLVTAGASVTVFDPAAERERVPAPLVADPYSACAAADMLVVLTEWPLFATADLDKVTEKLATPVAYDTRAILDPLAAIAAGLTLHRPGRVTLAPVGGSLLRS